MSTAQLEPREAASRLSPAEERPKCLLAPAGARTGANFPWVLAIALVLGAAVRFGTLSLQSFDEDETVTVWLMHLSLPKMLSAIPHTESTPPLYYVIAWLWSRLFGTGAIGLRSLSASIGVGVIAVCYLAGRELLNRRAAKLVAVLAALSPALVWYSQEARSYELFILTSAGALLFFARSLALLRGAERTRPRADDAHAKPRKTVLSLWALLAALSLTTHYFAAFLVAPEAAWLLIAARVDRRAVARAVAAVALAGLALMPIALRQHANHGADWIGSIPLAGRLEDVAPQLMLGEGRPFFHFFALALGLIAISPIVVLLLRGTRSEWCPALIPITIGLFGIAIPTLLDALGLRILIDHNALGAGVLLLIGCAVAMAGSRLEWLGFATAAALSVLFAWALLLVLNNPLHRREDWREAARTLGAPSVTRAVLYGPATNNPSPVPPLVPFQAVYLKDMLTMPDRGWTVREIDVLNVRDDLSDTSAPPVPVSPGRGFRLVSRAGNRQYTLFRFRSPRPVHVTPDELIGDDLLSNRDEGDTLVGLQIPTGRFRSG